MEVLTSHLGTIRLPRAHDKVYKDECMFSFDNTETPTGLYVSLTSFLGFGRDFVELYQRKTGNSVFLHLQQEKQVQNDDYGLTKFKFVKKYHIVVLPGFVTFPWPNSNLPEKVKASVNGVFYAPSARNVANLEALAVSGSISTSSRIWDDDEKKLISIHSYDLKQLDNGKKIPLSGWKCEKCDKTDNLWLNLTDGSILCGNFWGYGSGGNNHAEEHFDNVKYPLAINLDTITEEGETDVFSFTEDTLVENPNLAQHLAHWGINITKLLPIYGPGYTGMANLGHSCYLNSVMQLLFIVNDFIDRYFEGANEIFEQFPNEPASDFNVQMAKLATGLLSGKYSICPSVGSPIYSTGISPQMFKTLIGRDYHLFLPNCPQNAGEFLWFLLSLIGRNNQPQMDPSYCFLFTLEERVQTKNKTVRYYYKSDWRLRLEIPLEAAVNKDEVAAYEARKAEAESQGKRLGSEELVRPKVKLLSCFERFIQSKIRDQEYVIEKDSTKIIRLSSFPDYLFIEPKFFVFQEDKQEFIKLDVALDLPDILDLSPFRATGPQPEEVIDYLGTAPESRDGDSKYRLVGYISRIGDSAWAGHYVCHLLREGQWVLYDDNIVKLSEDPPKELAYLYLYERL